MLMPYLRTNVCGSERIEKAILLMGFEMVTMTL